MASLRERNLVELRIATPPMDRAKYGWMDEIHG